MGRRKFGRKQWAQFFAIVAKSGDVELAARKSRIGTDNINRMMAMPSYAWLKRGVERGLANYRKAVISGKIGHCRIGRPKLTLSDHTKERFLYALQQTGSIRAAASIIGENTGSLYRLRKREPAFAAAWDSAAEHGNAVELIAGQWHMREHDFSQALSRLEWNLEAAARAAGIPTRLATMIIDRIKPERVAEHVQSPPRTLNVNNNWQARRTVTAPEPSYAELKAEYEASRLRLTPQMQLFIDAIRKRGDVAAAAAYAECTVDQVRAWRKANLFFSNSTQLLGL